MEENRESKAEERTFTADPQDCDRAFVEMTTVFQKLRGIQEPRLKDLHAPGYRMRVIDLIEGRQPKRKDFTAQEQSREHALEHYSNFVLAKLAKRMGMKRIDNVPALYVRRTSDIGSIGAYYYAANKISLAEEVRIDMLADTMA